MGKKEVLRASIRKQNNLLKGWLQAYNEFVKVARVDDDGNVRLKVSDLALLFKPAHQMNAFLDIMHEQLDVLERFPRKKSLSCSLK